MNFDGIVTPQLSLPLTDDGTRWSLAFASAVLLCILGLLLLSQYRWAQPAPAPRSEPIIVRLLPEVPPSPVVEPAPAAPAPAPTQPKPEPHKPAAPKPKPKPKAKPRPVAAQPSKPIPRPQPPVPTVPPAESASAFAPASIPADSVDKPAISAADQLPGGGGRAAGPASAAGAGDAPAAYLSSTPLIYPEQARRRGWEGTVLLRVQLDANGIVQGVTILQSSGYSVLDQAAASQISRWRFKPSLHNGTPQPSTLRVPVKFRLEKP